MVTPRSNAPHARLRSDSASVQTIRRRTGSPRARGSSPGSYAVIGATAILSAAMQAPISSIALVLELTDSGEPLMVPLLIATAGAMLVSRALENRSIYSAPVEPKDEEDPKVDAKDEAMEQVKRRADASAGIPHVTQVSSTP